MKDRSITAKDNPGFQTLVILGAGHFGRRAAKVLGNKVSGPLLVVDKNEQALKRLKDAGVHVIKDDAVDYLVRNQGVLSPDTKIVPAVPFHLAWLFARRVLDEKGYSIKVVQIPDQIKASLPHVWVAGDGSFLISYADFRCPDDCPEPPYCTVTGQRRDKSLYKVLQDIVVEPFTVYVIRSRQMAPGVGGYGMGDLLRLCSVLEHAGPGKWLVGTACKCHGVLSALDVRYN